MIAPPLFLDRGKLLIWRDIIMSLAKYLIRCQERVRSQTSNSLRKTMVPAKVFVMDWTGDLRVKICESQRD